jgi:hypothetical protein
MKNFLKLKKSLEKKQQSCYFYFHQFTGKLINIKIDHGH